MCFLFTPGFVLLRQFLFRRQACFRDQTLVDAVRNQVDTFANLSRKSLVEQAKRLRGLSPNQRVKHECVVDAIALITEAVRRATGKTYYDVQLRAGFQLCQGSIAEIQTGEGKTLITAIPAFVFALAGRGVHVATTNDYLSRRDYELTRPAFRLLGLTTAHLDTGMDNDAKRAAYACDITYGPGYEFGFDYLRDQIQRRKRDEKPLGDRFVGTVRGHAFETTATVQRRCAYSIIDEADSVLIDEANTPLVLGGTEPGPQTDAELYRIADEFARSLGEGTDYKKMLGSQIELTASGSERAGRVFETLPQKKMSRSWNVLLHNALKANHGFFRDVDYVVQDGEVMIVDANTGRIHEERRWQGGLHQAIEIANGLTPSVETITEARITRQRYCQYYDLICGLTGTAGENATDFREFYGLDVAVIPTHRPARREVVAARYFANRQDKNRYLVADALRRTAKGQPVLVGTASIRESREIAEWLASQTDKTFQILNGVQDAEEADVIAGAGEVGAITIATNMAGRGTDIAIGEEAKRAGGLHVIAAEYQESPRVDRQLAGRAARQGDPGSVQFLASPEDKVIEQHDSDLATRLARIESSDGVCDASLDTAIERLQGNIDRKRLQSRRQMVGRDEWLENIQNTLAKSG